MPVFAVDAVSKCSTGHMRVNFNVVGACFTWGIDTFVHNFSLGRANYVQRPSYPSASSSISYAGISFDLKSNIVSWCALILC